MPTTRSQEQPAAQLQMLYWSNGQRGHNASSSSLPYQCGSSPCQRLCWGQKNVRVLTRPHAMQIAPTMATSNPDTLSPLTWPFSIVFSLLLFSLAYAGGRLREFPCCLEPQPLCFQHKAFHFPAGRTRAVIPSKCDTGQMATIPRKSVRRDPVTQLSKAWPNVNEARSIRLGRRIVPWAFLVNPQKLSSARYSPISHRLKGKMLLTYFNRRRANPVEYVQPRPPHSDAVSHCLYHTRMARQSKTQHREKTSQIGGAPSGTPRASLMS